MWSQPALNLIQKPFTNALFLLAESTFSLLYSVCLRKTDYSSLQAPLNFIFVIHKCTKSTVSRKKKSYRNMSTAIFSRPRREYPVTVRPGIPCGQRPVVRSQSCSSSHCGTGSRVVNGKTDPRWQRQDQLPPTVQNLDQSIQCTKIRQSNRRNCNQQPRNRCRAVISSICY